MIKIFSNQRQELTSDIDTWIVRWIVYESSFSGVTYPNVKECYQAFTNKSEAVDFANVINKSLKLIGITSLPVATIEKQIINNLD